ncbi:MAG: molybdenum cofactor sulfurase [Devosia sp.]|uniref:MOSC domain-containing protein n=1 Tax=Devosia sp. 66-22 TaxID=1895753 RepID=UPI00092919EC|nr:MOSC domain-containing protein [Devosia sp. 66-22]MBN9345830.1 molybdenum cofactor sulfurase [Devosia sp.]OJX50632.1 MAG: molybdenum cofactor sulfurase [Devosia sp. 66-22]
MAEYLPARTIEAMVKGVYWAPRDTFVSEPLDVLNLTYDGIPGDRHAGLYRKSGPREPWYPRGTPMRNERQLSILSAEENAEVAAALAIDELRPEWIGGNILLSGVPQLSQLPPRTLLMFPSGATVRIDGDNGPCKKSGAAIAANVPGRPDLELGFVKAAKHKRGLLGWVEREGEVRPGDVVRLRVWEQSLYTA